MTEGYASSEEEAERRYLRWVNEDPFPSVPAALLNSADIRDYVAVTGMVTPFRDVENNLKPASYEVALLGDYVLWDGGIRREGTIRQGEPFTLEPNSIAFVSLEPTFRLPAYMALRFNLRITHVYRGLLLGTGPLIDPGFRGKLSIPLHNLTTNAYDILGGEGLIWMEFTKLSPDPGRPARRRDAAGRLGTVTPLEDYKRSMLTVRDYLHRAAHGRPIQSSIPVAVNEALEHSEEASARATGAEASARGIRRFIAVSSIIAILFGLVTAATLVLQMYTLVDTVRSDVSNLESELREVQTRLEDE